MNNEFHSINNADHSTRLNRVAVALSEQPNNVHSWKNDVSVSWGRNIFLSNRKSIRAAINSIDSSIYRVVQGIPIDIEYISDDEYIATFTKAGIAISGDTAMDALQMFSTYIVDVYSEFAKHKNLGPEPMRQFKILGDYIGKKRGKSSR